LQFIFEAAFATLHNKVLKHPLPFLPPPSNS